MSEAVFQAPRRRCRVHQAYRAPFPVPRKEEEQEEEAGRPQERLYRAELVNQQVLVRDPEHILDIYGKGYFGKGILSRAKPEHCISDQWEEYGGWRLPVISHSKYNQLLSWAEGALLAQGLDEDIVSQTLLRLSQPIELEGHQKEVGGENGHIEEEEESQDGTSAEEGGQDDGRLIEEDEVCVSRKRLLSDSAKEPWPQTKRVCRFDPLASLQQEPKQEIYPGPIFCDPACPLVLVVCETGGGVEESRRETREVRMTPFHLTEFLQLSLEESFFLVFALGCLSVYENQEPLSVTQLWRRFLSFQPSFPSLYTAYHFYRSHGWVPKPGLKYGVDFMLYRKGPPFYHASYSVVVEKVSEAFRGAVLRPFTWRSLAAVTRITANVSKELVMCYIIYPDDLSKSELTSPLCLHRLNVQEVIVSRWVSSKERAEQDDI
ncbi:tRNA-splicing endonuclease subunit Sen2 [Lampris incognitus]|uniref:tRNA-splicing endonuclease subunit Sen2 n=1 Tax=Lampris incognitus TaxID=2546036 RepID=UPI0024B4B69A|nr:tRNA-splicing endonuclease subunit Sen2 [Lampris incognitus]